MKIYIVTQVDYSDYSIVRVFLNRNNANEYIEKFRHYAYIEEWDVSDANDNYHFRVFDCAYINYLEQTDGETSVYFHCETKNSLDYDLVDYHIEYIENTIGRSIGFHRVIPENADYDKLKARLTKACQDILEHVKYMREVEGMSVEDVNVMLNKMMETEEVES